ncbi:MAG TPA: sigma-70 family RNA polymerase sigma factor [Rhizomicrobium sp.]|nr:sigma-70 family RNA polymerase sigma factor [Rhizomicrobium sp.]
MSAADEWFEQHVLPLEKLLMQYLERNWRNPSDIADFRQDVYVRVYEAALKEIPDHAGKFLLTTARNLLINKAKHARIVPIESAANLEDLGIAADTPSPERSALARDELRHLQAALDRLPPRCREAIVLRRIHGLSRDEIAHRMNISALSVSSYLSRAICVLADVLHGEPSNIRRQP